MANGSNKNDYYWLLAALLLALVAFGNTLSNGFVFDDHFIIENNPTLRDPGYLGRVFNPARQDSPVTESPAVKTSFIAFSARIRMLPQSGVASATVELSLIVIKTIMLMIQPSLTRREIINHDRAIKRHGSAYPATFITPLTRHGSTGVRSV